MYALIHCTLYTGQKYTDQKYTGQRDPTSGDPGPGVLTDHALLITGNRILDVVPTATLPTDCPRYGLGGLAVAPGFVDLQLNGCGGVMFNDAITAATLEIMHATNLRSGTTHFLPTLITAPDADMAAAIALMQSYGRHHPEVLGLHLEGPYLNPKRKGIHNGDYVRSPDWAMVNTLVAAAGETVRLLTLAPEQVPAAMLQALRQAGITLAAGHTDATYDQAMAAFDGGITVATHLFNAMSPWQSRSPGMVGAVFHHPGVHAGIIVDGHHVHFASVALAQRLLGERLFLVTDATPPAGAPTVPSFAIGGQEVFYRQGKCVSADGTLGGSALTMIEAIAHCVHDVAIPLPEALRMASLYPAQAIGLGDVLGKLAPGYGADVVIFSPDFTLQAVLTQGQWHPFHPSLKNPPWEGGGESVSLGY